MFLHNTETKEEAEANSSKFIASAEIRNWNFMNRRKNVWETFPYARQWEPSGFCESFAKAAEENSFVTVFLWKVNAIPGSVVDLRLK